MGKLGAVHPARVFDDAGRPICRWCHAPVPKTSSRPRLYCSASCATATHQQRKIAARACYRCGKKLLTKHKLCTNCRGKKRDEHRFRVYGLTRQEAENALDRQGHACLLCDDPLTLDNADFDHDHKCCPGNRKTCGKCFRGLLCHKCNFGLGVFRDRPDILRRAIAYLSPEFTETLF